MIDVKDKFMTDELVQLFLTFMIYMSKHLSGKLVSCKCNLYKVSQTVITPVVMYVTMYNTKTCKKKFSTCI